MQKNDFLNRILPLKRYCKNTFTEFNSVKQCKLNKTSIFSFNILGSCDCMMTSKYIFDRAKSRV